MHSRLHLPSHSGCFCQYVCPVARTNAGEKHRLLCQTTPVLSTVLALSGFSDVSTIAASLRLEQLFAKMRIAVKQRLMPLNDRLLLRKRSIIETIIDQLKNISQVEHSRHRSAVNCFVNILGGLIAYCHQPKKPSIALDHNLLPLA